MSDVESSPVTAEVPQQRGPVEPPPPPQPKVVREFLLIHGAMRHSCGLLVRAATGLPAGSSPRAAKLADFLSNLLVFIHHHHTGEDEHWWPSLRAGSAAAGEVLAPLTDDHHELDPLLDALRAHAARLQAGTHDAAALLRDVTDLRDHLLKHLEAEEPVLLPLLAQMDPAEAERLGKLMSKTAPRSGLSYLLGSMNEAASEQEQQVVLGKMPAPIRWLRPRMLRTYRKNVAVLTGG
jgi:iron-sulfur cluster repair protein YtfE (RIC family)